MATVIGVYDWERTIKQALLLDLDLAWDNRPPADSDDLSLALDYDALSKRLTQWLEQTEFQLIESLAEHCARLIHEEFGVQWLKLTVYKPGAVKNAKTVGVQIERQF